MKEQSKDIHKLLLLYNPHIRLDYYYFDNPNDNLNDNPNDNSKDNPNDNYQKNLENFKKGDTYLLINDENILTEIAKNLIKNLFDMDSVSYKEKYEYEYKYEYGSDLNTLEMNIFIKK